VFANLSSNPDSPAKYCGLPAAREGYGKSPDFAGTCPADTESLTRNLARLAKRSRNFCASLSIVFGLLHFGQARTPRDRFDASRDQFAEASSSRVSDAQFGPFSTVPIRAKRPTSPNSPRIFASERPALNNPGTAPASAANPAPAPASATRNANSASLVSMPRIH
jgi:hypothetical protein